MFTNWLAPPTTSLPPDTIIEVGPPPFTRYAAHSALVSAHSGYLRAALRSDNSTGSTDTIPIYVPNVTAEQFTPLLTYMYTGFLDLNIENIFGVLLATHILHMPRALELCRAFLSATQSENYFSGLNAISAAVTKPKLETETSKVVRPIASKATGIGLNFIAPPTSHILLPSTHTPFKSLSGVVLGAAPTAATNAIVENELKRDSFSPPGNTKLTDLSEKTKSIATAVEEPLKSSKEQPPSTTTTSHKRSSKSLKRASSSKSDSIVTTASKESTNNNDKGIIIDIASCDGPVRFRRVLNDSYGTNSNNNKLYTPDESKSGRYMSTSFHQQMVRNINERKQQSLASGGESCYSSNKDENSQDNNRHSPQSVATNTSTSTTAAQNAATPTGETYNCVYCKHTFKSQYCYQKHAKRHLIPLTLDVSSDPDQAEPEKEPSTVVSSRKPSLHYAAKREVKPLDMNVQYYPCKTCGSKFPSYYFVHKHRKMCHADEEVL